VEHVCDRALRLWGAPPPSDPDEAVALFRSAYVDPVPINGVPTSVADLVARARMIHAGLEDPRWEILERRDAPDHSAFAFQIVGRHVGPLPTGAGPAAPSGEVITVAGMDIFVLADDRIQVVWAINDLLTPLARTGVISLR
jgi:hypothetical protein